MLGLVATRESRLYHRLAISVYGNVYLALFAGALANIAAPLCDRSLCDAQSRRNSWVLLIL